MASTCGRPGETGHEDVERALAVRDEARARPAVSLRSADQPADRCAGRGTAKGETTLQSVSPMQATIARRLAEAKATIPISR